MSTAKIKNGALRTGNIIGEYRVLDKIAEGGCGQTFKGEHLLTSGLVCLKDCSNLDKSYHDILVVEAKAMWDLRHHAIPAVRNLLEVDGSLVLVMSYIPGLTLEQQVEKHGRLDPESLAWIAERCLGALQYMHWHDTVHGDVKPHNIIIEENTHEITLVDFGLALVKPNAGSRSRGYTEFFAPPEQIAGKPLLPQSDLYSLGMTMIYALSGKLELVAQKKVPDETPETLREFIKRLIVRDPLDRPDSQNEDLGETMQTIRQKAFGRKRSGMKPIGHG